MTASRFAEVAVPVPLAGSFSYTVPASLEADVAPGSRVLCPFGRRKVLGIVLSVGTEPPAVGADKLKPLIALLNPEPVVPADLLAFLRELSSYYFAPIGEVLRLAVPAVERQRLRELEAQGSLLPDVKLGPTVGGKPVLHARATDRVEEPGSLRGQAAGVLARLRATGEQQVSHLQRDFGNARAALKKLEGLGLVELDRRPVERAPFLSPDVVRDEPPTLTPAQRDAVTAIEAGLEEDAKARSFMLFGVTGSGKTEVYMHVIATCLARGKGALVLVPEIALTPQLLGRFRARFGDEVALLHSGLPDADRHRMWLDLRSGKLRVAIGARSALFAPVRDLGLVVVDEEHDSSFKQEEGVRYHARDMALLRAHRVGAACVLGSATPSLESLALCKRGKMARLDLPDRAHADAVMPSVEVIDLKRIGPGPTGDRRLSIPLHRGLEKVLEAGEQAIVFLNRRGFSPSVICESCGEVVTCRSCSVSLTHHRRYGELRCHYCDYREPLGGRCRKCDSSELALQGLGTEKLEDTLQQAFPDARLGRLDRDTASGTKAERVLDRMRAGKIDILVGTQMVTKGHDLPRVTLVGVVNADAALSMPDFRAAERGFQLLVQVAGRAGRAERRGRVLVQTFDPEHAAIRFAREHDVPGFLDHELLDRREVGYPPFSYIALLRIDAQDEDLARRTAGQLAAIARSTEEVAMRDVEVLGPAAAPLARLRNRYRFRVFLRAKKRPPLRAVLAPIASMRTTFDRKVRVAVDVDPVSML